MMPDGPVRLPDGSWLEQPDEPLMPLDLAELFAEPSKPTTYLDEPVVPEAARVLVVGATGSGKSVWTQALFARLSRERITCAYFDSENPRGVVKARLERLGADPDFLRYFHMSGVNLESPTDRHRILYASYGCAAVAFDTLSSFFPAEERDNPAYAQVDTRLFLPLTAMGASVVILDHTGVPTQTPRRGIHAVRGQSAKAQKADVVAVVESVGPSTFSLEVVKNSRYVSDAELKRYYRVDDTEDGGMAVVPETGLVGVSAAALTKAEALVQAVLAAGRAGITQTQLVEQLSVSRTTFRALSGVVQAEEPARVRCLSVERYSEARNRKYASRLWVSAEYVDTLDAYRTQGGRPA